MQNNILTITNEDDLFDVLKNTIDNQYNFDGVEIEFKGWPTFEMRVVGEHYDATITPNLMKAFLELQASVYRSYAMARYNTPNATKLNQHERDLLTIRVKVGQGSSIFGIDFQEILENLGKELVGKMSAKTVATIVLGFAACYFADSAYKNFLDSRRLTRIEELKQENRKEELKQLQFAQEQETERAKILATVVSQEPRLKTIKNFSDDTKTELFKRGGDARQVEVQGVVVDGDNAAELMKNARRKSNEVHLSGLFRILSVDSSNQQAFKVKLRSVDSHEEFTAEAEDHTLDRKFLLALQKGEWERTPIKLHVTAKEMNGDIRKAMITYAEYVTQDN
ncbi:hypothetical protein C4G53_RS12760 [Vibrio parahaemolyticus]|nr:hypothetical protein [Vibrio parahaemolyticus]